jgi:drug/metabolite transporter (DMT)-like permease
MSNLQMALAGLVVMLLTLVMVYTMGRRWADRYSPIKVTLGVIGVLAAAGPVIGIYNAANEVWHFDPVPEGATEWGGGLVMLLVIVALVVYQIPLYQVWGKPPDSEIEKAAG